MPTSFRALTLFLLSILMVSCCQGATNVLKQGETIQDNQTLLSPGETFVLGFFSPPNSNNRYLGIWYNKIPGNTVVWVANREMPIADSSGQLTFANDGNLVVLDGTGRALWSTNCSVVQNNTIAFLLESGNLCWSLDKFRSPQKALWQSFDDPTDTYLPEMRIFFNPSKRKVVLTCWKSESDPSRGNFSVGIDPSGLPKIVLWNKGEKRWRSGPWNGQTFTGVPDVVGNYLFEGRRFFHYVTRNNSALFRLQVRFDGLLQLVYWIDGSKEWTAVWAESNAECELYNTCGANAYCSKSSSPVCSCLRGFMPKSDNEWARGNWSSGCVRGKKFQCAGSISKNKGVEQDQFSVLDRVKLPDFEVRLPNLDKIQCSAACSKLCSCAAYAYVDDIGCLTWYRDLIDVQIFSEGEEKLFIRGAASEEGKKLKRALIISIPTVVGVIFLCASAYIWWRCIVKSRSKNVMENEGYDSSRNELKVHSLEDILNATDNFSDSNKLGGGGFGPVYKGKLACGADVAVKRLSRKSSQGLEEFKNEIMLIAKLQHRNLVSLIGYCIEGEEKILVYEYMPNKSLDRFIFGNSEQKIKWVQRFRIIEGIARGLLYLHRDSRLLIIHRDLKAGNILLDEEMNPRISDFGLAKIFEREENQVNTGRIAGTYGYMAPEYAKRGIFSVKSDVYSFGVLLLEIVSGKRNQYRHPDSSTDLIQYAWKLWSEERAMEFIDPTIRDSCSDSQSDALRCISVGLLCVQDSAMHRPIMSIVVQMLESDTAVLPIPRQPTFTVESDTMEIVTGGAHSMTNTLEGR